MKKVTFEELLEALRHPDVDLPAIQETFARSLRGLVSERVLPLDQYAIVPDEGSRTPSSRT